VTPQGPCPLQPHMVPPSRRPFKLIKGRSAGPTYSLTFYPSLLLASICDLRSSGHGPRTHPGEILVCLLKRMIPPSELLTTLRLCFFYSSLSLLRPGRFSTSRLLPSPGKGYKLLTLLSLHAPLLDGLLHWGESSPSLSFTSPPLFFRLFSLFFDSSLPSQTRYGLFFVTELFTDTSPGIPLVIRERPHITAPFPMSTPPTKIFLTAQFRGPPG